MATEWFFGRDGHQKGPVSGAELKHLVSNAELRPDDLVWKEGMAEWKPAGTIKGLFAVSHPIAPPLPPPVKVTSQPPASIAPSMTKEWFIEKNGKWHGPFSLPRLKELVTQNKLQANDRIRKGKGGKVVLAGTLKGLFVQSTALEVSPSPTADIASPPPIPAEPVEVPKKRTPAQWAKSAILMLVIVIGFPLFVKDKFDRSRHRQQKQQAPPAAQKADVEPKNPVKHKPQWGFIDKSGKVVIPFQYEEAIAFSEGLASVKTDGKWGYIDNAGRSSIPHLYDSAGRFSEGLASVKQQNGNYAYINKAGQVIFELPIGLHSYYGEIMGHTDSEFSDGRIIAHTVPGAALNSAIDRDGNVVVPEKFHHISKFSDERAVVVAKLRDGSGYAYGIIDLSGHFVVPLSTRNHINMGYSEGLVRFMVDGTMQWGFLDTEGKVVISPTRIELLPSLSGFSEGLCSMQYPLRNLDHVFDELQQAGLYGYINRSGQFVIAPQFFKVQDFSDGLAAVQKNQDGQWGFIDKSGAVVIEPAFESVEPFSEGLAGVEKNDQWGFINRKGEVVVQPQYSSVTKFSEGRAAVQQEK